MRNVDADFAHRFDCERVQAFGFDACTQRFEVIGGDVA